MSIKDKVKMLLKEAELYKSQRLLNESKNKYLEAISLIKNNELIPNRDSLISAITKKIDFLNSGIVKWEQSASTPEVSPKVQDLIQKLFTTDDLNDNDSVKALKSAITLAKFGQYKRAIKEFNNLVSIDHISIPAAKNSIKCILENSSIDDAIAQYNQWVNKKSMKGDKILVVKKFLQEIIDKLGLPISIDPTFPREVQKELLVNEINDQEEDDDIIDITSIGIRFNHGPKKGEHIEFDVSFQAGNVLSLIVSSNDKLLIESLKIGVRLDDMDFYSPIAIFKGSGIVEANTRIETGPKRGDYSLDIKIHSI
ncbi:MAG: hypothetical protein WC799_11275 [Desulfobacteraceae bacterium]|jgi:tetratricopeptide (TPR) repeat protein